MTTDLSQLALTIAEAHEHFSRLAARQVNTAFTLRNWLIGFYIVGYEQGGADRAQYGERVLKELAARLKANRLKGMSDTNLKLFRQFYQTYPQIGQAVPDQLPTALPVPPVATPAPGDPGVSPELLLSRLSFTHIVELLKADGPLQRAFYETEAIRNNWSTRELQRAMNSMLFERTGLSQDKATVLEKHRIGEGLQAADVIRSPYVLEFLGLPDKAAYSESDLEESIINHLQEFLLEAGRGFCFEARQKRITFGNTHYRIDLVFYHRILKCHVLVDLKLGEFTHADAGQMNLYLNYYKDQEMTEGDNPPVGIILCARKDDALVQYATGGLPQTVFVSKYLVNLPSEEDLRQLVRKEQEKLGH
jgi:predicted nuclease of restriction endonuclease-like (RecB) superfamily